MCKRREVVTFLHKGRFFAARATLFFHEARSHKITQRHRRNRRVTLQIFLIYRRYWHQKEKEEMEAFLCNPASETKQTVAAASRYDVLVEPEGKAASTDTQKQLLRYDPPRHQNPLS